MACQSAPLDRVFIELGPLTIYWYGVIIAVGLFLGLYLAQREAKRFNIEGDTITDLIIIAAPISIVFARIYYVIFEWEQYKDASFVDMIAVWEGGIAIHGALIGAVLTAIVYTRIKKISFWQIADILAPSIILGQAIGRWGNFMNQEAHGGPMSQAAYENFHQYLPSFIMDQMCIEGTMYYPTFLYESFWNILVFVFLLWLRRKNPIRGEVFLSYVATYSIGRLFIEGLRTDSLYLFGQLRTAQILSIVLIVGSVLFMLYRRKIQRVQERYNDKDKVKK